MIAPPSRAPRRVTALALAIALIAASALAVTSSRLSDEQQKVIALQEQQDQIRAELEELRQRLGEGSGGVLDKIQTAVARLRGLKFLSSVKASVLTNDELRRRIKAAIEKDSPKAEVDKSAKVLRALGLLSASQDLYQILLDLQLEQVGGYFDSDEKVMVVAGSAGNPSPFDRTLLAHEYTHALTDQHFDLGRLEALSKAGKDDEAEAFLSLVEGDATLLMGVYAREVLTDAEKAAFAKEAAGVTSVKLDAAPKALRESLLFPYQEGVRFAQALFDRGGNAALDRAYKDPPTSTEQILHPERYYDRLDAPTTVTMPDLVKAMGAGWSKLQDGGVGELDMRLILGEFLTQADTRDAANGWDGGRYAAIESTAGVVVASLTVWDSQTEASEAEDALRDWLPARFGRQGGERRVAGYSGKTWVGPGGAGTVVRSGERVLFIVGPNFDSIEKARAAFSLEARSA